MQFRKKSYPFRVISLFLMAVVISGTVRAADLFLISKGHVGGISLGQRDDEIKQKFPGKFEIVEIDREGAPLGIKVKVTGNAELEVELDDQGNAWAIRISNRNFYTEKGIRVGDSFEKIRKAYPHSVLSYGIEDGAYVSLYEPTINGFFTFDTSKINAENLREKTLNVDAIANIPVEMILLHNRIATK